MTDPARSEGDVNLSPRRALYQETHLDDETRALLARDSDAFLHQSLSTPCLDVVVAAAGSELITQSGRRLLDFHGNSVHQLGHGHPRVVAAIKAQLDRLPFAPRRYANLPALELAERLGGLAPADLSKVLFAPSGATAISMALRLARHATGRHKTLSMWDSFHGATIDAISIGGEGIFRRNAGPLLPGSEHVPPPGLARRFFGDDERAHERLADYIDYILGIEGDVAALIAEPVRWTTLDLPPPDFWPRIRAACDRHGTLLIFDEIPSALGRTGTMFVTEQMDCVPDLLVIGKGLGGGIFPMAALLARRDLDVMGNQALGHFTHEKSPVGAAAALATLDAIEEEELLARSARLGKAALAGLGEALQAAPHVLAIRGLGLSIAIEIGGDAPEARAERILYLSLADGLSFKIGAGTVITLCPPLTIREDQLQRAIAIVLEAITTED